MSPPFQEAVIAVAPEDPATPEDSVPELPETVPDEVLRAATAALRTAASDEVVADCVRDSLLSGGGRQDGPRRLEFRAEDGTVVLTVLQVEEGLEVAVEVTPAVRCALEVRQLSRDGELLRALSAESDDQGRAVVRGVPAGLASVAVRPLDASFPALRTAWLRL